MKLRLIIILCIATLSVYSQSAKKEITNLLATSKNMYESSGGFRFNTTYRLYNTYTSVNPAEEYSGVFVTKEEMSYTRIGDTEFINLNDHFLHIDNSSKLIDYKDVNEDNEAMSFFDVFNFIGKFKDYSVKKEGNYTVCILSSAEVTFVPYSKVVIYINNTTKEITKQVLYLLLPQQYKDKKGGVKKDYPRVEVSFSNLKKRPFNDYDVKFNLSTYLQKARGKYEVTGEYKGYTIIDSKN